MDRQTLEWDDSAYSLMIQCKRAQKQLSLRYHEAKNASSPSGAGQWLVDNFYILSREERETRTALKANPKGVARLAVLFFGELRRHPLGEQELRDLILMEDSRSRLTVEQLEQVALSLKVAYLLLAADAFGEEEREEWISRAVLGLQQLGGVDFAALEELGAATRSRWRSPAAGGGDSSCGGRAFFRWPSPWRAVGGQKTGGLSRLYTFPCGRRAAPFCSALPWLASRRITSPGWSSHQGKPPGAPWW